MVQRLDVAQNKRRRPLGAAACLAQGFRGSGFREGKILEIVARRP